MGGQENNTVNDEVNLGGTLRHAREKQGLSIASVAMQTHLRTDVIEKLENNEFAEIGAPVFTRGYLNIYARFLKVDLDLVEKGYQAGHDRQTRLKLNPANIESQRKPYKRSNLKTWLKLFLVILLGGVLIYQLVDEQSWLLRQIKGAFAAKTTLNVTTQPKQLSMDEKGKDGTGQPKQDIVVQVEAHKEIQNPLSLTAIDNGEKIDSSSVNTTASTDQVLSLTSLDNKVDSQAGKTVVEKSNKQDNTEQNTSKLVEAANSGQIILIPTNNNWIQIKDSKGKILYSKVFKAEEKITLDSKNMPYQLNIGRPEQVKLTIDGVTQSLSAFKNPHATRLFTIRNLKEN